MPIYTYRCENCGVQFEQQQSFTDDPLTQCPECSKTTLRKVFQPVRIVFKGSGFYATDHHSPSGESQKKDEKAEKAEKSEKSEKSDEKKPVTESKEKKDTPKPAESTPKE